EGTPGVPVQTFEAAAATFTGPSDVPVVPAPDPALLQAPAAHGELGSGLLRGKVTSLAPGDELLLVPREWPGAAPTWARRTVVSADPDGGRDTRVRLAAGAGGAGALAEVPAADFRVARWTQSAALWTQKDAEVTALAGDGSELTVNLAGVVRGL